MSQLINFYFAKIEIEQNIACSAFYSLAPDAFIKNAEAAAK